MTFACQRYFGNKNFSVQTRTSNWILFIILSIIWGSSFILMKIGMEHLSAYQVASIRILSAGIVLLPFTIKGFKQVPKNKLGAIVIAGLLGNFFPAYLYCLAEIKIDSSLASILNALTPLCAILIGVAFFQLKITVVKIIGVIIGLAGLILLPLAAKNQINFSNFGYSGLVLVATICYGTNVHVVAKYLKDISSLQIAAIAFVFYIPVCLIVLIGTGFFSLPLLQNKIPISILAASTLGIMGTAIATIWFYKLVKTAGSIFASTVTYGIPVIAIVWGVLFGETITVLEIVCLLMILAGVYVVNRQS
jgi:drug/metabolite transporter (DMT)-like permease